MDNVILVLSTIGAIAGFIATIHFSSTMSYSDLDEVKEQKFDKLLISFCIFGFSMHGLFTFFARNSASVNPDISYILASFALVLVTFAILIRMAFFIAKAMLHKKSDDSDNS